MAEKETNSKIIPYRRYGWLNIGTILFGAIFIYMIITVLIYLTASHITSYEVTEGSISGNYRYTALALKNETVVTANYGGYVRYFARNAARANIGMNICAIDEHSQDNRISGVPVELKEEDYSELRTTSQSFSLYFDDSAFQEVYNFKADLESYLLQLKDQTGENADGLVNNIKAQTSGFILYETDGMEQITEADLKEELFNRNQHKVDNLRLNKKVKAGDPVFKIVSGEDWNLYFPISDSMATDLQDRTSVRFRFLKDDTTFGAAFEVIMQNGRYYGKISLENSLVRYVGDRYLEIELLMDGRSGLKIPSSAIAEQVFYKIPKEYVIENSDNSGEVTLLRQSFRKDGTAYTTFLAATVYDRQEDGGCLVSRNLFKNGDYVQMADTTKKHQITSDDLVTIQGVYNINKGYAVFREVNIRDNNEEFCIAEPYNPYGLAAHDFIALNASSVKADDLIN